MRVLTRRITAIEALGAATVLCVDKTGTLTQNRMAVRCLWTGGRRLDIASATGPLPAEFAEALRIGVLASEPSPFDPMERAFHDLHGQTGHSAAELVRRYPLSAERLAVTHVWRHDRSLRLTIAAKGAPEASSSFCGLTRDEAARVLDEARSMATSGLRVLGIATAQREEADLPADARDFSLRFVGLVGLADPLRPAVPRPCANAARPAFAW